MKGRFMTLLFLTLAAIAATLGLADMTRCPEKQVTAQAFQAIVGFYHAHLHPITGAFIRCHYRPTCSNYSSLAVKRFGLAKGLWLTAGRVASCRSSVVPGTLDAVPEIASMSINKSTRSPTLRR